MNLSANEPMCQKIIIACGTECFVETGICVEHRQFEHRQNNECYVRKNHFRWGIRLNTWQIFTQYNWSGGVCLCACGFSTQCHIISTKKKGNRSVSSSNKSFRTSFIVNSLQWLPYRVSIAIVIGCIVSNV